MIAFRNHARSNRIHKIFLFDQSEYVYFVEMAISSKKVILEEQRLIFIQSKLDIQNINWKIKLYGHVGFTLK